MTHYRKPIRGSTRKPHTIANEQTASLLQWLTVYPFMAQKPRAWFNRQTFTPDELAECYAAGYPDVAVALGFAYPQPLTVLSQPMIITIDPYERAA